MPPEIVGVELATHADVRLAVAREQTRAAEAIKAFRSRASLSVQHASDDLGEVGIASEQDEHSAEMFSKETGVGNR